MPLGTPLVWLWAPRSNRAMAGRVVPNSRAVATMSRSSSVVTCAAQAGVRSLSSTFHQSIRPCTHFSPKAAGSIAWPALNWFLPSLKSPTKAWSHQPWTRISCAIAKASAPSVPGLSSSARSAAAAVGLVRTSTMVTRVLGIFSPRM